MRQIKLNFRMIPVLLAGLLVLTTSCNDDDNDEMVSSNPDVNFTALTNANVISKYNARNLGSPSSSVGITGLAVGEQITSIDYRPATGQLYGLSSLSRIYVINEQTGLATAQGTAPFAPVVTGANASINFNPQVDRIRLVTESGQNLRVHPELGTVAATDTQISGNANTRIGAAAYNNSIAFSTTATVMYDIDFGEDKLYIQNPNPGTLTSVGNLGVDFQGVGDMDIMADNSQAMAVTYSGGQSTLYSINLSSGQATSLGGFSSAVIGIAFKTNPVAYAVAADGSLNRFNPTTGVNFPLPMANLAAGETIVGIDFRPANATLYAVSNQSKLYTVNLANGFMTPVATLTTALSGTSFGVDFNPMADRLRIVSNTGQNLRVNVADGVTQNDTALSPGTPNVNATAYSNSFAGTTSTTMFTIDSTTDILYSLASPNSGIMTSVGALGVNVDTDNGFDIGGSSNTGYALLRVGGTNSIYSINLTSGAATLVGSFNVNATGMAVGLGF